MGPKLQAPDAKSPVLHLDHPLPEECTNIWINTSASWKDSLPLPVYLLESRFLTTVPLAKDGGMTTWILVDKTLPPSQRQVLCSCESYRKRSLTADAQGNIEENLVHGIASVFCPPEHRGRGYAARHMVELAKVLRQWQPEQGKSVGSVLYSDIGKTYYAKLGWLPSARNIHLVFPPAKSEQPAAVRQIDEFELETFCLRDEAMIRAAMATPDQVKRRVTILPDLNHMLWHIHKEAFVAKYIFGTLAKSKGAVSGTPGKQVWAIWVRRYYRHPDQPGENGSKNILFILRLVVEGDETANRPPSGQAPLIEKYDEQAVALKAVLQAAQEEAVEWRLDHVHMWEPSPLVQSLITRSGLEFVQVERQEEGIASALWFNDGEEDDDVMTSPVWINNEYYAWC